MNNVLFKNFQILQMTEGGAPYGLIPRGDILVADGKIVQIGPSISAETAKVIDGNGRFLGPGLIDCHTHLVWGGLRAQEWEQRLAGASYEEIARQGGGILSTVEATRKASVDQLFAQASRRVRNLIRHGVTTVEIKSGYGLDIETELKMLEVATRIKDEFPLDVHRTFLGAHTLPPEYRHAPDDYVNLVCGDMLDAVAQDCESIDVFCESVGFSLMQSKRVLEAGRRLGLSAKIHAEQLSNLGGALMAAELGAISADHLEYLDEPGVQAMANSGTTAVLLPGAFYFIHETQVPPIQLLRDNKVPIAIASDTNPGSSPILNPLLAANMACTLFRLTPEEALLGLTLHAARALGMESSVGSIEVGKQADFAIWDIQTPAELAYFIGHNPCLEVYKAGQKIQFQPTAP